MKTEILKFRRQYLISPVEVNCPFLYKEAIPLFNYGYLYCHVDLKISKIITKERSIILLGDIYDYEYPSYSNEEIISKLINLDFKELLEQTNKYAGRFVIISLIEEKLRIFHDASASRKIYYANIKNEFWCSSQPRIIAELNNLEKTKDDSLLAYYNSQIFHEKDNASFGNYTLYDEIKQLMPNHYLDFIEQQSVRFWPNKKIKRISLEEGADICSRMLQGIVEAVSKRYKLMIPVTAGLDSRSILAASYNIKDDVIYYINKTPRLNNKSPDIRISSKLLRKLKLQFNIIEIKDKVSDDFKDIYFKNSDVPTRKFIEIIYNYYKNFSDKINLPATFVAIAKNVYHTKEKVLTGNLLADFVKVGNSALAIDYFHNWLKTTIDLCEKYNISILDLFYWEERMGNWGTQIQTDKDIAQEELMPYNSRNLVINMLGVESKYRVKPTYILQKQIVKKLWPETLQYPINPSIKKKIKIFLQFFGYRKNH